MKFFQKHMGVMSRHFWEEDHEIQIKRFQDRRLARRRLLAAVGRLFLLSITLHVRHFPSFNSFLQANLIHVRV